jgi:hypothetical protein
MGCGDETNSSAQLSGTGSLPVAETQHLDPLPPYEQAPIPEGFESDGVERDIWYLDSIGQDDQTIRIAVQAGCTRRLVEFTVETSADVVSVTAWQEMLDSDVYACPDVLEYESLSLRLPEPLAGRVLAGACIPGDATDDERLCQGLLDVMPPSGVVHASGSGG